MSLELTDKQRREKAIQHVIASTFTEDASARIDILTAALARVIRSRTGKPLAERTASGYAQKLRDALTTDEFV